jgi:hypothetical protein
MAHTQASTPGGSAEDAKSRWTLIREFPERDRSGRRVAEGETCDFERYESEVCEYMCGREREKRDREDTGERQRELGDTEREAADANSAAMATVTKRL